MDRFLIVDGNSIINRAFYGQGKAMRLSNRDGIPTGALHTFMMMLLRYRQLLQPTHICIAFDTRAKTFRHEHFAHYKAGRSEMPEDLAIQLPLLKDMLDALSIERLEKEGFEADDLLGTLAELAARHNSEAYLLTGDKDALQLISGNCRVVLPPSKAGQGDMMVYDVAAFQEKYGILPEQFVDVKALMGDSSDNIPGVPGVGEKTALKLIAEYENLDALYAHTSELKGKIKENIEGNKDKAYLSRALATIDRAVPLPSAALVFDKYRTRPLRQRAKAQALLSGLGLQQLYQRLNLDEVDEGEGSASTETEESRTEEWRQVELQSWDELAAKIELWKENGYERLFISFSPAAADYKTLKEARALYTADAVLSLMPQHKAASLDKKTTREASSDSKQEKVVYFISLPAVAAERAACAERFAAWRGEIVSYRVKELWREGLGSKLLEEAFDVETCAYVLADISPLKNFSDLYETVLKKTFQKGDSSPELACRSCVGLAAIYHELAPRLAAEAALLSVAEKIDFPLAKVLGKIEEKGFLIDPAVLDDLHSRFQNDIQNREKAIYLAAGHEFNINSTQQLSVVLYEELGLKPGKKRQNEAYSTDQMELQRLYQKHPIIPLISGYRQLSKLDSTFVKGLSAFISPEDGRIHSSFNQNLTNTGRLSSKDPNLQNIPIRLDEGREIRAAFIAAPGYVLLDADYSQIELRLLAHLAQEEAMLEAFRADQDIHTRTARKLFAIKESQVNKRQRAIAKTVNFSIIYGISAFGLAQDLDLPLPVAKHYIDDYNEEYPAVKAYMDRMIQLAKERGYAETLFGRRRYVTELQSKNHNIRQFGERVAMNTPVQGTAADIIRRAMLLTARNLEQAGLDAAMVSQVHDELIVEVREDQALSAARILQESMEGAANLDIPLKAEVAKGVNWLIAKT